MSVPTSGFSKVSGGYLNRIPTSAHNKVYSTVVSNSTLINLLKNDDANLTFNNRMMKVARFPNSGMAHPTNYNNGYEKKGENGNLWFS